MRAKEVNQEKPGCSKTPPPRLRFRDSLQPATRDPYFGCLRASVVGMLLFTLTICGNSAFGQAQPPAGATAKRADEKAGAPSRTGGHAQSAGTAQPPAGATTEEKAGASRPASGSGQGASTAQPPATKSATGTSTKLPAANDLPSIEEMIAAALQSNPDLLVAESKVREAEAERNRARLQVVRQVITLRQSLQSQRDTVARLRALYQTGSVQQETLSAALAALADLEAQVPYLLGKLPQEAGQPQGMLPGPLWLKADVGGVGSLHFGVGRASGGEITVYHKFKSDPPEGAIADSIRKAAEMLTDVEFIDTPLKECLQFLGEQLNVKFIIDDKAFEAAALSTTVPVTLQVSRLPLGAVLQAMEDLDRPLRFVVRDYGILVTTDAAVPADGVLLRDFWKPAEKKIPSDAKK